MQIKVRTTCLCGNIVYALGLCRKCYGERPGIKEWRHKQGKEWRKNNPERAKELYTRWRQEHPEKAEEIRKNAYERRKAKKHLKRKAELEEYKKTHPGATKIPRKTRVSKKLCSILKKHAEDLKDDPERLSTDFIQNMLRFPAER